MSSLPNILTVDDNRIQSNALERTLRSRGFRVKAVYCGRDAVSEAREGCYDAILLDVHMPDMDGLQACTIIRADSTIPQPAIVCHSSAEASQSLMQQAYEAGADAFLTHPLDDAELASVLLGTLAIRRSQQNISPEALLKAGQSVPRSGIYTVRHVGEHMTQGEVVLFEGVELPRCAHCDVTYSLRKAIPHISEDVDFQS